MAPEQARAEGEIDFRADIYALGASLFRPLTGRPLFQGDNPIEVVVQALNDTPPHLRDFLPNITVESNELVDRCLAKWPDDRHESIEALLMISMRPYPPPKVCQRRAVSG